MTSEGFELPKSPKFYPNNGTYADLLYWHLYIWGTRSNGPPKVWDVRDFLIAVFKNNADAPTATRSLSNWLGGGAPPKTTSADLVMKALFQEEEVFEDWRIDLRAAWKYSSDTGNNKNTLAERYAALRNKHESAAEATGSRMPFAHHQWHKLRAEPTNLNELLRTDLRATTLVGRTAELAMLSDWLSSPSAIAVKCIVGGAGAGKTRLAIEACEAAEANGWFAAFLPSRELLAQDGNRELFDWTPSQPTLLIIDYAATSVGALKHWFNELALLAGRPASKLRILLLERHADRENGWWASLTRPDSNTHATSADLIGAEIPYVLPPLDAVRDRRALLAEVMAKAAPLFDPPRTPIMPPALGEEPWFDQRLSENGLDTGPLYLAMIGICAVDSGVSSALAMNRLGLAHRVAVIERERLQAFAVARRFTDGGKLLQHIAACITLQSGCELSALPSLINEERLAMKMTAPFDDETITEIICDFLPVVTKVEPVRPDLIGESFCLPIIDGGQFRKDVVSQDIVLRCWERDFVGTVDTLVRCACDLGQGSDSHESVAYLPIILRASDDTDRINALYQAVPSSSLALKEFAVEVSLSAVERLKSLIASQSGDFTADLAIVLQDLAYRLSSVGRRQYALDTIEWALLLLRALASERPGHFTSVLAMALNTFANALSGVGQYEEARLVADEALTLRRELCGGQKGVYIPDLAMALITLANRLNDLDRYDEACPLLDEALILYRGLAAERPQAFIPNLASTLNNLANTLTGLGRLEEAYAAAEEALILLRPLAVEQPDALIPTLAFTLNTFANLLLDLNRFEEALAVAGEALTLFRQLSAERDDTFMPGLATALCHFSSALSALGRHDEALIMAEESATLYQSLASERPNAFMGDLAAALNNLSNSMSNVGRNEEALVAAKEASALLRQLTDERPGAFTYKLAITLTNFADRLGNLGHYQDASEVSAEALTLYQHLANERPDSLTPYLVMALNDFANRLSEIGRREQAFAAAEEALVLLRQLATEKPELFALNLVVSLYNFSKQLSYAGQNEKALDIAEEELSLCQRLADSNTEKLAPNLAIAFFNKSNMLGDLGRYDEAIIMTEEALTLYRKLADNQADVFIPCLITVLNTFAKQLSYVGRNKEALAATDEARALR